MAKTIAKPKPAPKKVVPTPIAAVPYPEIEVRYHYLPGLGRSKGIGPLTEAQAIELVGWESEDTYRKRMEAESGGDVIKGAKRIAGFGDDFLLKDIHGVKIQCWKNDHNRPFTPKHAYELAQDILNRNWRLNLENIIISRTGKVLSEQHRLIGLILACQMWRKDKHWQSLWSEPPVIETLIAYGADEDPDTVRTIDNVRPRALSDVFYVSPVFAGLQGADRIDCSRYLDQAVDLLWKRVGAGRDKYNKHQTHSSSLRFFDAHPKLKVAVKYIADHNKDRELSQKSLYCGHCAAMLYLMGSCKSDRTAYDKSPSEKSLNWDHWQTALDFWKRLADDDKEMHPITLALGNLADPDTANGGGRITEKLIVITKAWHCYLRDEELDEEALKPEYTVNADHQTVLADCPTVGGIDLGAKIKKVEAVPTEEEIAARAAVERSRSLSEKRNAPIPKGK